MFQPRVSGTTLPDAGAGITARYCRPHHLAGREMQPSARKIKKMIHIEVIGLEPPCGKCTELLENAKKAVQHAGVEATVKKQWTLSGEIRNRYGLLLSPALVIDGMVVAQGKVYRTERIIDLLQG